MNDMLRDDLHISYITSNLDKNPNNPNEGANNAMVYDTSRCRTSVTSRRAKKYRKENISGRIRFASCARPSLFIYYRVNRLNSRVGKSLPSDNVSYILHFKLNRVYRISAKIVPLIMSSGTNRYLMSRVPFFSAPTYVFLRWQTLVYPTPRQELKVFTHRANHRFDSHLSDNFDTSGQKYPLPLVLYYLQQ